MTYEGTAEMLNATHLEVRRSDGPALDDGAPRAIQARDLGDAGFRADYGIKYAYLAGAMYKAIASVELVTALGRAGLLGFYGTGGMSLEKIETAICAIQQALRPEQKYGMNLLCNLVHPELESRTVELFLKHRVRHAEAAAFMQPTPSLVRYRLAGISRRPDGSISIPNRVLAKVSRPEVASWFMQPAPAQLLESLVQRGKLNRTEAELGRTVPLASEICVEADSGGHTDQGVAYVLMPAMLALRDEMASRFRYEMPLRVGAAGGIGSPHAAAAAFVLGADFVLTGSINQCTVEAGTSDAVKDILQDINVQDTAYAPAGDMFELGARVQVLRKGLFFPARANKLYELYQRHGSIEEIDAKTQQQIQERFFKRSFAAVWDETRAYYARTDPGKVTELERNPKQRMAAIFRWYFVHTTRLALQGSEDQRVDYQVHCGPALGAFNQWVRGTELASWRNRRVANVAEQLIEATAALLNQRIARLNAAAVSR